MYQHLHIAMEKAQQRLQHKNKQDNIRRRRRNTIEICPTAATEEPVTTYDNQMEKESNIHIDLMHQISSDPEEIFDIDDDFNLLSSQENTTEFESELNSYCEMLIDDQDEPLLLDDLFPPSNNQNNHCLHFHTTVKTHDFCKQLIEIFRDANISNIHRSRILTLINDVLPQPHNSPTTLKALYNSMQVEQLFIKRLVCTQCHNNLSHNDKMCNKCNVLNSKSIATIFDINQPLVFVRMLDRLLSDIENNWKQVIVNHLSPHDNNNDVMYNQLYKELQNNYTSSPFISILFHLDGISLYKSTKLTLWLFSCSFIELPVHLRYRRFNMVILSVWIGHQEPRIDLWLCECLNQLNHLKNKGSYTFFQ